MEIRNNRMPRDTWQFVDNLISLVHLKDSRRQMLGLNQVNKELIGFILRSLCQFLHTLVNVLRISWRLYLFESESNTANSLVSFSTNIWITYCELMYQRPTTTLFSLFVLNPGSPGFVTSNRVFSSIWGHLFNPISPIILSANCVRLLNWVWTRQW